MRTVWRSRYAAVPVLLFVLAGAFVTGCGKRGEPSGETALASGQAPGENTSNLVKNGSFEQPDDEDPTLPSGWRRSQATKYTVALIERDGGRAVGIKAHPEGKMWQTLYQTLPSLSPGAEYRVGFEGRVTGDEGGRVTIVVWKSEKEKRRIAHYEFSNSDWQAHEFWFVMPTEPINRVDILVGQNDYKNPRLVVECDEIALQQME